MAKINAPWHAQHPMPKHASAQQRIAWHQAHAQHCACRPIPKGVLALMAAAAALEAERPPDEAGQVSTLPAR